MEVGVEKYLRKCYFCPSPIHVDDNLFMWSQLQLKVLEVCISCFKKAPKKLVQPSISYGIFRDSTMFMWIENRREAADYCIDTVKEHAILEEARRLYLEAIDRFQKRK